MNGAAGADGAGRCWLCTRPIGRRTERHHPVARAKGGRDTVPMHPICHHTIHARFSNAALARIGPDVNALRQVTEIAMFLDWIADKPPDFHAPTPHPMSPRR